MEQTVTISVTELQQIVHLAAMDAAREVVREVKAHNPKYNRNEAAKYLEMSVGKFDTIKDRIPCVIDGKRDAWLESDLDEYNRRRRVGPRK